MWYKNILFNAFSVPAKSNGAVIPAVCYSGVRGCQETQAALQAPQAGDDRSLRVLLDDRCRTEITERIGNMEQQLGQIQLPTCC